MILNNVNKGTLESKMAKSLCISKNGFKPFTFDSGKSKIDQFSKITNWVKLKNKQHHSKVMCDSFPVNGNTLGFCP